MIANLGSDVLGLVLDALVGDKPTLCMCALASPILRRRARHHLFSDIRVTSLARASALVDLLDADPAIGGCVDSLTVSGWNPAWVIAPLPTGLCALLPRFPRLVALELDGVWCREADRARAIAAALPTSLRRLELCHVVFITEVDIVALLTAAPHLRYVVVFECDYLALEGPRRHMPVPTVESEELTAIPYWDVKHVEDGEPAASWLAVVSPRRLAFLTVTLYYESDVPFWQACINQAGSVMRKLEIAHCDLTCVHIDLSALTTLRTLIINLHDSYDHRVGPGKLTLPLIRALETVTSSSLELALLIPECMMTENVRLIDWHALRAACEVVRTRAPRLRVLIGMPYEMFEGDSGREECERTLREAIVSQKMENLVGVVQMDR